MTIGYHRPTKAIVDCQAIYNNIKKEQNAITDGAVVYAVVKADAYGHGAVKVAEVATKAGVSGFCVSLLDEALELRAAGVTLPILILGVVPPEYVQILIDNDLTGTVPSLEWLETAHKWLVKEELKKRLVIHVKIDTGMGRLGIVDESEMKEIVEYLKVHQEFDFEGLYTHFAKADSKDISYLKLQQERFEKALSIFPDDLKFIHTSNSATALWHNHWKSNLVRLGAAMYGLNPSGTELEEPYVLEQAMSLVSELVHVKKINAGEHVSYGAEYQAKSDEWIGTLPIGYADGVNRRFKGFEVIVAGEKAEIVGKVCMDQCMIRLPKKLPVGTKVTIFGKDGELVNSIQQGAEHIGTINYEIPCMLTERVELEYIGQ